MKPGKIQHYLLLVDSLFALREVTPISQETEAEIAETCDLLWRTMNEVEQAEAEGRIEAIKCKWEASYPSGYCPVCRKKPTAQIWPFCSTECLRASPDEWTDPDFKRRHKQWLESTVGAGGPGGMIGPSIEDGRLKWYMAGAQDEAAYRDGIDWGEPASARYEPED